MAQLFPALSMCILFLFIYLFIFTLVEPCIHAKTRTLPLSYTPSLCMYFHVYSTKLLHYNLKENAFSILVAIEENKILCAHKSVLLFLFCFVVL